MITVEEAIRSRLLDTPDVTAIVGTRVYVLTFPQSPTWPAMRVQSVSEVEDYHLRGAVGMRRARVQVDAVAITFAECARLIAAAHGSTGTGLGLTGFTGVIDPDFKVAAILADGARSEYDADELNVVRMSRDYAVIWRQG